MLDNYSINKDGLIYQVKKSPFVYDIKYVEDRYDTYGELNTYMSNLRLGYVVGSAGIKINSILDIGYGNASFLKTCKKIIPNCYGFDITNYPLPEGIDFIRDWQTHKVDVITFFDVLEHFEDPYVIKNLNTKYIIISAPWCHYIDDNWFLDWKHRRPNEHLWFFNEKNIRNFANSTNYKLVSYCNIEDSIRGSLNGLNNIITFCLEKII